MKGAFDGDYGSTRQLTPEMVKAGQNPLTFTVSGTDTNAVGLTTVATVDASSNVIVWGITCVTNSTSLQGYELVSSPESDGSDLTTIVVAGGTNAGPFFYSFDTPHACPVGDDLYVRGIEGTATSYCVVYYSTVDRVQST